MPKLALTVTLQDHPRRDYFVLVAGGVDKKTLNVLRLSIPGADNEGQDARLPIEMVPQGVRLLQNASYIVRDERQPKQHVALTVEHDKAFPYQKEGAARLVSRGTDMLNYEMGTGKTLTAILALRELGNISFGKWPKVLVICPANVRNVWVDELDIWWKGHPAIFELESAKQAKTQDFKDARIVATSYELLHAVPKTGWNVIVVDEAHYVANAEVGGRPVKRSKQVRELFNANPKAYRWFLTATPITNEPIGLHNQLDILWPGRFGNYWDFAHHYCKVDCNDYTDHWVHGVNPIYARELADRLLACSHRVTKDEVAHLMPPFMCSAVRVKAKRGFNPRKLFAELSRMDFHKEKSASEAIIRACSEQKIFETVQFAEDHAATGERVAVLTHLKDTSKRIEAALREKGLTTFRFDGDTPQKTRRRLIQMALAAPGSVLVCTMHSVKEGVNTMAGFDCAILGELYYTIGVMNQVIGRFHRASASCNVYILFVEGSHEEVIAMRLKHKSDNAGKLMKKGQTDKHLSEALTEEEDEEDFEAMRKMARSRVEEDAYA